MASYLCGLANRCLTYDGQMLKLHSLSSGGRSDLPERVAHWRWLSLRLPSDLLIAALHANREDEAPAGSVALGTHHLREVLRGPVAETHLHAGAAFTFSQLWTFWMGWMVREAPSNQRLQADEPIPFGTARDFIAMLFSAATVRLFLAAFLQQWDARRGMADFSQFCGEGLQGISQRALWPIGPEDCYRECRRSLRRVVTGAADQSLEVAKRLYGLLVGPVTDWSPSSRDDIYRQDPLSRWLPVRPGLAEPEVRFTTRGLSYLLGPGRADTSFAVVFWQYQRIRCQAHTFLVEEPGTAGLDWFQKHYRRLSSLRGPLDLHLYRSALELDSEDLNLRALEVRTTPSSRWYEIRDEVRRLASSTSTPSPELGLIFHFIKERENRKGRGSHPRLHADPSGSSTGFRFGAWYLERQRQADAIVFALDRHPELLLLLRGLDVASAELATPTWVTLPLIERVRSASRRTAAVLRRIRPQWSVPPVRVTYHAGEDFRRLNEGFRRVHELLEFGVLHSGDRIGHGLVLGIDVTSWAEQAHRVVQPAEERLDDLLWELELYSAGALDSGGMRLERTRTEALVLGQELYGTGGANLEALIQARRLRHNPTELSRLGFPHHPEHFDAPGLAVRILWRHLTDVGVFRRGQRPIEVQVDAGEVEFLKSVQRWIRILLRDQEITIETNPSSNLLISNMIGLEDHPALSLGNAPPVAGPEQEQLPLLLSINSDDPITFATSLAHEYAYIYFAMLRSGSTASEALRAIDTLRETGWRSRFTLAASTVRKNLHALGPFMGRAGAP
jgi:hypothetical protein